ncbi:unnamed protein product [Coregonus sp. 'balchen']|nr:unnamed protein product [Coregonus sp. 'balchen']
MSYLEDMPVSGSSVLEGLRDTPASVIQKRSSEEFQINATNKVRKILIKSVSSFPSKVSSSQKDSQMLPATLTIFSRHTDSTAFEIVGSITNDMKSLFPRTESSTTVWQADSMLQQTDEKTSEYTEATPEGSQSGVEVSEKKIWTTAKTIYHNQAKTTKAQAKKTFRHILVSIQKELSKPDQTVTAGELSQIENVVGMILEDVEKITPIPSELPENTTQPILRCSVIDMGKSTKPKTLVCDARESMSAIVDTIIKEVYSEEEGKVASQPDQKAVITRLEELISQGRIGALSRDLTHQVHRIISESNLTPLVLTVAAGKSASDTVLRAESLKRLLLPALVPSLVSISWALGVSVTASSLLSGKSSSLPSFTAISMATSETSNAARGFEANIDAEERDTTSCSSVAQSIVCDQMSTSPDVVKDVSLSAPSSDNLGGDDDFTGLISMLVVGLLSKIQTQTDLYPFDITRTSQNLIPKVIAAFCACLSENLRIHKVYSTIYKHLLKEFGSEKILQLAVSTQDSTFNKILASRAASRTYFEATWPEVLPMDEDVKATRGKLSFLQRLTRLKLDLKPFKMGNKKDSKKNSRHSEYKDQTTAEDSMLPRIVAHATQSGLPEDLPSTSQQEKPRKRPF